jgi:hypothetical protein
MESLAMTPTAQPRTLHALKQRPMEGLRPRKLRLI